MAVPNSDISKMTEDALKAHIEQQAKVLKDLIKQQAELNETLSKSSTLDDASKVRVIKLDQEIFQKTYEINTALMQYVRNGRKSNQNNFDPANFPELMALKGHNNKDLFDPSSRNINTPDPPAHLRNILNAPTSAPAAPGAPLAKPSAPAAVPPTGKPSAIPPVASSTASPSGGPNKVSAERKTKLDSLLIILNPTPPAPTLNQAILDERAVADRLNAQTQGSENQKELQDARVIGGYISKMLERFKVELDRLNPTQDDIAYLNQQTDNFFDKFPIGTNNIIDIPLPFNDHIKQLLYPPQAAIANPPIAEQQPILAESEIGGTGPLANNRTGKVSADSILGQMKTNLEARFPSQGLTIAKETNITDPNRNKLIVNNSSKTIEFEATPGSVKGKANKENMEAMAVAIVANLEARLKDPHLSNADASKLSIKIDATMPPEKAAEFERMIKQEMIQMQARNNNGLKFMQPQVNNPHPPTAAASIGETAAPSPQLLAGKTGAPLAAPSPQLADKTAAVSSPAVPPPHP